MADVTAVLLSVISKKLGGRHLIDASVKWMSLGLDSQNLIDVFLETEEQTGMQYDLDGISFDDPTLAEIAAAFS